jgi:hypothetical protein
MSEAYRDRGVYNMSRGGEGVYEEEWDCGVLACDKGSSDAQWEYLEEE